MIGEILRDLFHPRTTWRSRDARDLHTSRGDIDHEQYKEGYQPAFGPDFDGEEVGGRDRASMCYQKLLPLGLLATIRRRFDATLLQNILHGIRADRVPEIQELRWFVLLSEPLSWAILVLPCFGVRPIVGCRHGQFRLKNRTHEKQVSVTMVGSRRLIVIRSGRDASVGNKTRESAHLGTGIASDARTLVSKPLFMPLRLQFRA